MTNSHINANHAAPYCVSPLCSSLSLFFPHHRCDGGIVQTVYEYESRLSVGRPPMCNTCPLPTRRLPGSLLNE
jgi:hypothetical protein